MTRVDAHQHFWKLARGDYRWLKPEAGVLYRDFAPSDLLPHLRESGVQRTVLVQAADSVAESEYLLDLAASTPFVAGVVGWVDMAARDAARTIERLALRGKLVGIRPMLQDLTDDAWVLRDELVPAFETVLERRLCFDALVHPRHLRHVVRLVARHPELSLVIDHAAKPCIREGGTRWSGFGAWRDALRELARSPRVHCKLSGLLSEAFDANQGMSTDSAHVDMTTQRIRPFADVVMDAFGPSRVLWGSDWPVVELAGGYSLWWRVTERLLAGFAASEREAVLGENAARFYGGELARPAASIPPGPTATT